MLLSILLQAVIQRKTEQLQAVSQKAKDAGDLAKWAAQRREERDAEKAKRLEAFKSKPATAAAPAPLSVAAKPPVPRQGEVATSSDPSPTDTFSASGMNWNLQN